jgi:RNA polymerase sigma-70 factor (ECF subfamily)
VEQATAALKHARSEVDEPRLILLARKGNQWAIARLVARHQSAIFAYVKRMVHEEAVAEELTQDVFLKAIQGLESFRGASSFATWLYRIAVNHTRDYMVSRAARDRARETSLGSPKLSTFQPVSSQPAPDAVLAEEELAALFQCCLEALETSLREAFILRHQEGLSYDEISGILGISKANAKVRVHRARERILGELRARGYDI